MTTTLTTRTGRALVPSMLFDRLVRRTVADDHLDQDLAERVVDQALAFLAACARNTSAPLAPSELVDLGWHAFLLHTRDYAGFCEDIAGRFLHHVPIEPDAVGAPESARDTIRRTIEAIENAGFTVDPDLWPHADAADCTGCHNGCHDDPPPAR
ncbi:glycine-rich domain-containing protein [Actinophytocola sp. KF-1]